MAQKQLGEVQAQLGEVQAQLKLLLGTSARGAAGEVQLASAASKLDPAVPVGLEAVRPQRPVTIP